MNDAVRTMVFSGVAVVALIAAVVTQSLNTPQEVAGFEKVGTQFFPDFENADAATRLQVTTFNEELAEAGEFVVTQTEDGWVIPSHNNYPTDAKDQLAKTATSVIGLTRGALASRLKADHEKFGVISPLDEESGALKGRGSRVTLSADKGGSSKVLADYVIGEAVEGQDGYYFVRRADEDDTYRVKLDISVSTKFSDWIEPDLLKLASTDLRQLKLAKSSVGPEGKIAFSAQDDLSRESSSGDWTLAGLNEETEEIEQDKVRSIVTALDDLKLVGVRPKPDGMTANFGLKVPRGTSQTQIEQLSMQLNADLQFRGFRLGILPDGEYGISSNDGDLTATTENGVAYHLHIGSVFTGSTEEIEIGNGESPEAAKKKDAKKKDAEKTADADDSADSEDEGGENASRYLYVRVTYDASALGPEPTEPVKPVEPSATETTPPAKDDAAKDDAAKGDAAAKDEPKAAAEASKATEDETKPEAKPDPKVEYQKALAQYEQDLVAYNTELQQREDKAKQGAESVEELNTRFEKWYYVVSDESIKNLLVARDDLVKAKEKPAEEGAKDGATPDAAKPDGTKPDAAKPDAAKPDAAKPDAAKPDAAKPDAAKPKGADLNAPSQPPAKKAPETPKADQPTDKKERAKKKDGA